MAIPDLQKTAILGYLTSVLRSDAALLEHIGEPRMILQTVLGRPPYEEDDQAQITIYQGELPVLCCWRFNSSWQHLGGMGASGWAHMLDLGLCYLFAIPSGASGGDADALEESNAWAGMVWDRVARALHRGTHPEWGETGNLKEDGKIDGVECKEMSIIHVNRQEEVRGGGTVRAEAAIYGWLARVELEHRHPPHLVPAPEALTRIDAAYYLDGIEGVPVIGSRTALAQ